MAASSIQDLILKKLDAVAAQVEQISEKLGGAGGVESRLAKLETQVEALEAHPTKIIGYIAVACSGVGCLGNLVLMASMFAAAVVYISHH